ncbi:helix-turn-helix domain-containing protein [Pseudomonas rhizoryzae]|uniref:AraC-like ligand-binding domain-containing protein n=1 Tax=Pseudomonas rhizoryzae TaxID=2571129 RepID=UPI0007379638|nr:AraC family transcriptional regulator [Pseudomonas rhizoryzae]KTT35583.1 hypothetical protein SB9_08455 [Pseudomonas psychrotolerans]KTT71733.1 hypothetical protein SB18R_21280 [Pseudomonas psychrotolerans]
MDRVLLSERSQVFAACAPGQVSEYVGRHLGSHRLQIGRDRAARASLAHRSFAALDLCRLHYAGQVRILAPALDDLYHLQILLRGRCLWQGREEARCYGPGELMLLNPSEPVDLVYSDDCEKFIVKLPAPLLARVCQAQGWTLPAEGIRFVRPVAQRPSGDILDLLALICHEAEESLPNGLHEPYLQLLVAKLLLQLPSNLKPQADRPESSGRFTQLLDYLEAHLGEELSPRQLAAQVHLSERALFGLFQREVGCAPLEFVRRRRLERARATLLDPRAAARSVTEVALAHGFLHLGRFAQQYKARFGESPSATWRGRAS